MTKNNKNFWQNILPSSNNNTNDNNSDDLFKSSTVYISKMKDNNAKKIDVQSNIIDENVYQECIQTTLKTIADALSRSLGYYGSTSILETENMSKNNITKDGYTILQQIRFNNPVSNTILNIIQDVASEMVHEVGDGSTSSIISASSFYQELTKRISDSNDVLSQIPRKEILNILKEIEEYTINQIHKRAVPIDKSNFNRLRDIAAVSNNNDDHDGKLILSLFKQIGKDGRVTMEKRIGSAGDDEIKIVNGISTSYGYIDDEFIDDLDNLTGTAVNPYVFMLKQRLTTEDMTTWFNDILMRLIGTKHAPVVVIAPTYDPNVINNWKINKKNNMARGIDLVIMPTTMNTNNVNFDDLAVYLGAKPIDSADITDFNYFKDLCSKDPEQMLVEYLGIADKVIMDAHSTTFLGGNGSPHDIQNRLDSIKQQIKKYKNEVSYDPKAEIEIERNERRIANLSGKVATLYIAGSSLQEQATREYLLDDSIRAAQSALRHGYVSGGNLIVPKILRRYKKRLNRSSLSTIQQQCRNELIDILSDSMLEVFRYLLRNTSMDEDKIDDIIDRMLSNGLIYNLKEDKYERDSSTHIINSAMTDELILKTVVSLVGLVATSNQYIAKSPRTDNSIY